VLRIAGLAVEETVAVDEGDAAFTRDLLTNASDVDHGETATLHVADVTYQVDGADASATVPAGVSLDEEMTNLIRFQRGYQAAARAMSTTDTMLETLINRTGRVGL